MADLAAILSWIFITLLVPALIWAERKVPRTRGRTVYYHLIYAAFVTILLFILPDPVKISLFSPLGVAIIGTIFPIYESIRAICTPVEEDDKVWLQYWIAQGILSYSTEWVDDFAESSDVVREYWYEFLFFYFLWLLLPYTDGMTLTFDYITQPLLTPCVKPLAEKFDNWLSSVVTTVVSASHLWFIWFAFVFLDPALKRFITVSIGFVYPLSASIVAATTRKYDDDTFWLTYWSCYECLLLIMHVLERWVGRIPGFYTLVLFSSVYLMLPLFYGAEKVFRKILVPLAGLQEMLLIRDSHVLKREIMNSIPLDRAREVRKMIAESFAKDSDDDDHEEEKVALLSTTYQSINETPDKIVIDSDVCSS